MSAPRDGVLASAVRSHARHSLSLRDGKLRLAVVADSHSQPHEKARAHLAALRPDYVLHAGDIGRLAVLDELEEVAPVLAVRGNIDPPARDLPETLSLALSDGSKTRLTLLLIHIGVYGVKLRADAARLARSERAELVVCGHSHVPFIGRDRGLSIFNPGSVGPRRFHLPIVFGLIDVSAERVEMRHVSCETGETWTP
jgi:uncharacterized protein